MSTGVIFYNWGLSCVPRLMVALSTFKRWNPDIPAVLMVPEGDPDVKAYALNITELGVPMGSFPIPAGVTRAFMQPRAKLWALDASPFDTTAIYENDFLFQGSVAPVFEAIKTTGFGLTPCRGLRWGSGWVHRALRQPGWAGFPGSATLLDDTSKVYNNGLICVRRGHPFIEAWRERYTTWAPWVPNGTAFPLGEEVICAILANDSRARIGELWTEIPEHFNQDVRKVSQESITAGVALHYPDSSHVTQRGRHQDSRERWRAAFRNYLAAKPANYENLLTWDPKLAPQIQQREFAL